MKYLILHYYVRGRRCRRFVIDEPDLVGSHAGLAVDLHRAVCQVFERSLQVCSFGLVVWFSEHAVFYSCISRCVMKRLVLSERR